MQKSKIQNIISKYNLSGRCQPARWKIQDKTLTIVHRDEPIKTFRADVTFNDFDFEPTEFGIFDPVALKNILGALDTDFDMKLGYERNKAVSLQFDDSAISAKFLLASLDVIPEVPEITNRPDMHIKFDLDKETMSRFTKSLSALKTTDKIVNLAIFTDGENIELVLNYHPTTNTTRITLNLQGEVTQQISDLIAFSANLIGDIFEANKDCLTASVSISLAGLMVLNFVGEDWQTSYMTTRVDIA
jgi:hypothetical protein